MKANINKLKREVLPFVIVYLLLDIIVVGSICSGIHSAPENGEFYDVVKEVFTNLVSNIVTFKFFGGIFQEFSTFLNFSLWLLIIFVIMFIAWKIKFAKTSEYDGRENGSSSWSKNGEEFDKLPDGREVLNKKQGFILSKDHYLGTDLRKVLINKNILVVGRFRCW